jgi:hypothetical protein
MTSKAYRRRLGGRVVLAVSRGGRGRGSERQVVHAHVAHERRLQACLHGMGRRPHGRGLALSRGRLAGWIDVRKRSARDGRWLGRRWPSLRVD